MPDEIVKAAATPAAKPEAPKPTPCPVCLTPIPPGRDRCPGCGKWTASAELCPHCNNPSPAVPYFSRSGAGCLITLLYGLGGFPGVAFRKAHENELVCQLCGAHRGFVSGPALLAEANATLGALPPDQAMQRAAQLEAMGAGRSWGLKAFAAAMGGASVLLLLLVLLFGSGWVTALGITAALAGLLGAAGLFVAGRGLRKRYARDAEVTRLRALADLAKKNEGVLRLEDAATALRLPPGQVEPILSSLVDGTNIKLEVADDGGLVYQFADWMPKKGRLLKE
jgi:hypothetical protein